MISAWWLLLLVPMMLLVCVAFVIGLAMGAPDEKQSSCTGDF